MCVVDASVSAAVAPLKVFSEYTYIVLEDRECDEGS